MWDSDDIVWLRKAAKRNPMNRFLTDVEPIMRLVQPSGPREPGMDVAAYVEIQEARQFARDILSRVELLSYAYDRLCELVRERIRISAEMEKGQEQTDGHVRAIDLSRVSLTVRDREARWESELGVTVAFAHYEFKSVVDLLRFWGVDHIGPESTYLCKIRDRFLSHSQYLGVMRRAKTGYSYPYDPGPALLPVTGLNQSEPISHDYYLRRLQLPEPVDQSAERVNYEQLVLHKRRNESLAEAEVLRLKAFGVREPDLECALRELASVLESKILPRIREIYQAAQEQFGFSRH